MDANKIEKTPQGFAPFTEPSLPVTVADLKSIGRALGVLHHRWHDDRERRLCGLIMREWGVLFEFMAKDGSSDLVAHLTGELCRKDDRINYLQGCLKSANKQLVKVEKESKRLKEVRNNGCEQD